MRYVAKSLNDRILHLADAPHIRSYCSRLRGDLVVVDADYASERIADRTVTVCKACRTALEDRRAAAAMEDSFMITATEGRARVRPQVEPTLFGLGDAGELPVVGVEAVIAAGVLVVGAEADPQRGRQADAAAEGGEGFSNLSRARQIDGLGVAVKPAEVRVRPLAGVGWENGRTCERAAVLEGWATVAGAAEYAARFPECVEVRERFERYEGALRRSALLSTVHAAGVEFPARLDVDGSGWTVTLPTGDVSGGWGDIVRAVRAYVLAEHPANVVAFGECHENGARIIAQREAEYAAAEAEGVRALEAVRADAARAEAAFTALRTVAGYRSDDVWDAVCDAAAEARRYAAECERVRRDATARWWECLPQYATRVQRAAAWLTDGATRAGVTVTDAAPGGGKEMVRHTCEATWRKITRPWGTATEFGHQACGAPATTVRHVRAAHHDYDIAVFACDEHAREGAASMGAAPSGVSDPGAVDTWESEGGACVGVDTPRSPGDGSAAEPSGATGSVEASPSGEVVEAEEGVETADIVIRHTHQDGTTVDGSSKGDGVWEALRPLGWAYRRNPGIFIRGSRYKGADRWKINQAADAVRALGLSCAVVIEETMSFAEREAARVDAAGRCGSRTGPGVWRPSLTGCGTPTTASGNASSWGSRS